jgi:hypothetical protein
MDASHGDKTSACSAHPAGAQSYGHSHFEVDASGDRSRIAELPVKDDAIIHPFSFAGVRGEGGSCEAQGQC